MKIGIKKNKDARNHFFVYGVGYALLPKKQVIFIKNYKHIIKKPKK